MDDENIMHKDAHTSRYLDHNLPLNIDTYQQLRNMTKIIVFQTATHQLQDMKFSLVHYKVLNY